MTGIIALLSALMIAFVPTAFALAVLAQWRESRKKIYLLLFAGCLLLFFITARDFVRRAQNLIFLRHLSAQEVEKIWLNGKDLTGASDVERMTASFHRVVWSEHKRGGTPGIPLMIKLKSGQYYYYTVVPYRSNEQGAVIVNDTSECYSDTLQTVLRDLDKLP